MVYDKTRKASEQKMPLTKLTVREMAELKNIQYEKYGDLFERGLSGGQLSDAEKEQLLEAGKEIYGEEGIDNLYYSQQAISAV